MDMDDAEILQKGDLRLAARSMEEGLIQLSLSSHWTRLIGFKVTAYLYGDLLIDTGFAHVRKLICSYLAAHPIRAICCTHNHEDHSGNCGALARQHHCPVYLFNHSQRWSEGVGRLARYRRIWWGRPEDCEIEEMPATIQTQETKLRVIPVPGHSQTQVAFFAEQSGLLFVGDLYITGGLTAVMRHENPFQSIASLRRVAALKPRRMFNGHGLVMDQPAGPLREKADRLEQAAARVLRYHQQGWSEKHIMGQIFSKGVGKDWFLRWLTQGEFCRLNFVRACLAHGSAGADSR